jgi:hypothetical protein
MVNRGKKLDMNMDRDHDWETALPSIALVGNWLRHKGYGPEYYREARSEALDQVENDYYEKNEENAGLLDLQRQLKNQRSETMKIRAQLLESNAHLEHEKRCNEDLRKELKLVKSANEDLEASLESEKSRNARLKKAKDNDIRTLKERLKAEHDRSLNKKCKQHEFETHGLEIKIEQLEQSTRGMERDKSERRRANTARE